MRVAALYDIHGNLPALEAVLVEVREAGVDQVVVGGDVVPGPMPREALELLMGLELPVRYIHGNGELAVLAQIGVDPEQVTYWGTTSGAAPPEPVREIFRWTAREVGPDYEAVLHTWPRTCRLTIPGLGDVLFCHASPRSETDCFTRLTPEHLLAPLFEGLGASLVVCGHTHMQYERTMAGVRVINAGSVGMSYGIPGAAWALFGPDVQFRRTPFDVASAAARIRRTGYPDADAFAAQFVLQTPDEAKMLELFTHASFK
jgi:predicted phosphodiesterase